MESNWNFPQLTADKNKEIFISTVARITKIIGQTLTGKQQPSVMCRGGCCWRRVDTRAAGEPRTMLRCYGQRGRGPGSVACRPAADPATQHPAHSTRTIFLFLGGFSLTFVFVGLGLDAEDGDHHDDDDDGGRGQRHHEPDLAVEGLGLEVAELEVHLGRRLDLGNNGNV